MPKTVTVDFNKAPPAQGGRRYDLIDEGTYQLKVTGADSAKAKSGTGRTVISIDFVVVGPKGKGKRIGQNFTLPASESDSYFGLSQFHALLLALTNKMDSPLEEKKKIDLSKLVDLECVSEVQHDTLPATDSRKEMTISKPVSFYSVGSDEATAKLSLNGAAPAAAAPVAPEEAEAEVEESSGDDTADTGDLDSLFD